MTRLFSDEELAAVAVAGEDNVGKNLKKYFGVESY